MASWLGLFLIFGFKAGADEGWLTAARRLTGESDHVRRESLAALKKRSGLIAELTAALDGPDRALALDVIASLSLKEMVPALKTRLLSDPDGFTVLGLNALLAAETRREIGETYIEALTGKGFSQLSPGALVAMVDALGRMGVKLPSATLRKIMAHKFHEVRFAGLHYVRTLRLSHGATVYGEFIAQALRTNPYQLRVKALLLVEELKLQKEFSQALELCREDFNPAVRDLCRSVVKAGGGA